MKKRSRFLGLILLLSPFVLTGSGFSAELPPLVAIPAGISNTIVTPDPTIPKEIRDFCGEWSEGTWMSRSNKPVRRAKLFITKVSANKAEVLYGCGDSLLSASRAFWFQGIGEFRKEDNQVVMILTVNDNLHRFRVEDGKLIGLNPFLAELTLHKLR